MRKVLLACVLVMLFGSKVYADGAIFVPIQHSDLLNSGTNTHAIIDTFIASKGQPNGLAALDGSGNIVVSGYIGATNGTGTGTRLDNVQINSGTGTLSGVPSPFIGQVNGTSSGTRITDVQIISGTGTLSGVPSPYIAQTSGTSTGGSHTACYIFGSSTIQSDSASNSYILNYSLGTTTATNIVTNGTVSASNLVTGWRAGATYGYGILNLAATGDITFTPTYDNATKQGTITASLTGTTSAKPNLSTEAGLVATGPGTITFHTNFNVTSTGTVKLRDVVQQTSGTATGLVIANASITSGSGTLSGVASPYVAQTSGTGTLLNIGSVSVNHNGASITGGTISGVDMCFGDNDTGVNWIEDGHIQFKTNSNQLIALSSVGIPSVVVIGTTTHTVNTTLYGNLTVTGTTTLNGLVRSQLFNTPGNGTFTASTSVIYVTVMGGGGGGGGGSGEGGSGDFGGGGGGSGQFIPRTPLIVTNGNDYSVVVGAGGSGGTAGAATGGNLDGGAGGVGGTSTFSTLLTASGGGGGGGGDYNTAPGAGGSGGSYNSVGILGKNGNAGGNEDGGTGAISALGSIGGVGGIVSVGTSSIVSMQGCGGGGGGCGTNTPPNSPGYAGGNGSSGFVLVEY